MYPRTINAGLSAALVLTTCLAGTVAAQDEPATPEGQVWELTAYTAETGLTPVPEGVVPSLSLADGVANGNAGCNQFSGSYSLDGTSLSIAPELAQTMMACEPDAQAVEDAYLALLPTTAAWQSSAGTLELLDAQDAVILAFVQPQPDIATVIALLEELRSELNDLRSRVDSLEAGQGAGGGDTAPASKPAAPTASGPVETVFPDWMRDGLPPDQIADKNREVVEWRDNADDETGYRVYARRGYCQLKPGTDPNQALDERDFRLKRTRAVRVDRLPADSTSYQPDHAAIDRALPDAPVSPYSNDQFYDLYVAAFNDAGKSKRVLVGSFFLTPEFRCP